MKAHLKRERTGSNYIREQRALFGELDPAPVCFLQLVGKLYPLKAVCTLEKKEKQKQKKIIPFRHIRSRLCLKISYSSSSGSPFFSSVGTVFKGYRLPTSCEKHTDIGSRSIKRARCFVV